MRTVISRPNVDADNRWDPNDCRSAAEYLIVNAGVCHRPRWMEAIGWIAGDGHEAVCGFHGIMVTYDVAAGATCKRCKKGVINGH